MERNRGYRRRQRRRFIRRRLKIILNAWGPGSWWGAESRPLNWFPFSGGPGRLGKFNLACSCWMCRGEKYDRLVFRREMRGMIDEVDFRACGQGD